MIVAAMSTRYVEKRQIHFIRERVSGVDQIRIPKQCNWYVLIWKFLEIIIIGPLGIFMAREAVGGSRDLSSMLLVIICVVGCVESVAMIAYQFAGAEIIRADRTGLETSVALGWLRTRIRFFRAEEIRNLTSSDPHAWDLRWPWPMSGSVPRPGAIKFDYRNRTIYAASLADEVDGPLIVDWLRPKLPRIAIAAS